MTPEVKAAAETIRDLSGDVADCLGGGMPHDTLTYRGSLLHELCQAALTVKKAYLELVPADSELPIDEAWLRSVGFSEFVDDSGWFRESKCSEVYVSRGYRGQWLVNGQELPEEAQPTTRGQLRLLCRALSIPLAESPNAAQPGVKT